jgi:hypothetical protein
VSLLATLQIKGPRLSFVAVERATGDAGNLLMIDDGFAIQHHGDVPADKRDVESLPRVGTARLLRRGRQKPVHTARMVTRPLALRFSLDLHFVAAAKIHTAVGVLTAVEFNVQLEVLKLLVADELRTIARADQIGILYLPVRWAGFAFVL